MLTNLSFLCPFSFLIATSNRDEKVCRALANLREAGLMAVEALASARKKTVKKALKGVNYAPTKARWLIQVAQIIKEKFGGKVPADSLLSLPGVHGSGDGGSFWRGSFHSYRQPYVLHLQIAAMGGL